MTPLLPEPSTLKYRLLGVSALEKFFGMASGPCTTLETDAELTELARIFETLEFPGLPAWDALVPRDQGDLLIRTSDDPDRSDHPLLQFTWDPTRRVFQDPHDLYPLLKEARTRLKQSNGSYDERLDPVPVDGLGPLEAAVVCARFPFVPESPLEPWHPDPTLPAEFHRLLFSQVMTGPYAWRGLEILMNNGYIESVLPELLQMDGTDHSKEGHPEGNVWRHTLETLRYRKTRDLNVGLALLLHDSGKPFSTEREGRRFDRHAEIGADVAGKILRRLGFNEYLVRDVRWLIRHHMIPGALERLPGHRRDPLMASPLFPLLLELYRCDLSSTYRGPDGYYRACTVYRQYLKRHRRSGSWDAQSREHRRRLDLFVESVRR